MLCSFGVLSHPCACVCLSLTRHIFDDSEQVHSDSTVRAALECSDSRLPLQNSVGPDIDQGFCGSLETETRCRATRHSFAVSSRLNYSDRPPHTLYRSHARLSSA